MGKLSGVALIALVASFLPAHAQVRSSAEHPRSFCSLGAEIGYPAGAFTLEDFPGCSSRTRDLSASPGKNGLRNNLAFHTVAEPPNGEKLYRISLLLHVNNPAEARAAHAELWRAADLLSKSLLGRTPSELQEAIGKRELWRRSVDTWTIEVERKEFSPGIPGYQVMVRFRPR